VFVAGATVDPAEVLSDIGTRARHPVRPSDTLRGAGSWLHDCAQAGTAMTAASEIIQALEMSPQHHLPVTLRLLQVL
jgi:hypothetical protein